MPATAILLLAYGGPDSLEDIPAYLLDIRGGRHTPTQLVEEISERYRLIGGRSPLLGITNRVADKVAQQTGLPVYVGMRHWHPYVADVVTNMANDGIREFKAICMAPHYSSLSIARYREELETALATLGEKNGQTMHFDFVDCWYDEPAFLAGVAGNLRQTFNRWPREEQDRVMVIFTAHSLPAYILDQDDPYDYQLRETAASVARALSIPEDRWTFCYQSAAKTGMPWLGPQIDDLVVELAGKGEKNILIAPVGFIADHVEILYDIDIGLQTVARLLGVRLERMPMLNDSEPLVETLVDLVREETVKIGSKDL